MPADDILQLVTILIILVLVMAAAYITTRYIARFQQGTRSGNNIEVIETYRLSPNMYAQIVRMGKTYVAIAVCKDTVTKLAELQEDEVIISDTVSAEGSSFQDILARLKKPSGEDADKRKEGQE